MQKRMQRWRRLRMKQNDLPLVADPDFMEDEIFVKHMNARHMPIGGLAEITGVPVDAWWPYHERLHRLEQQSHEHITED